MTKTYNDSLPPLPSDEEILQAFLGFDGYAVRYGRRWHGAPSANALAHDLGIVGARRLGRGAVKGSWTGEMSGSLRLAPRLRSLERRALVSRHWDRESGRYVYSLTNAGRFAAQKSGAASVHSLGTGRTST